MISTHHTLPVDAQCSGSQQHSWLPAGLHRVAASCAALMPAWSTLINACPTDTDKPFNLRAAFTLRLKHAERVDTSVSQ